MGVDRQDRTHILWHATDIHEIAQILDTDIERGLTQPEAEQRLKKFGHNHMPRKNRASLLVIFLRQFKNPLIGILFVAASVTVLTHDFRDALFIVGTIIVNIILGLYQENKAENALAELKNYLRERCRVVRGGVEQDIDTTELVVGDLLRIAQGDRVGADAILVYANDVRVDESILTGEAIPSEKKVTISEEKTALADRHGELFAGTLVTQGIATAVVIATGANTELGAIARMVASTTEEVTPLQKSVKHLSLIASFLLLILTLALFAVGLLYGYDWSEMFLMSVALAVSAIPEGLPVALTVILAVGVERMARRKGVVRRLVAAEALGSTTVILTDKTGTLTTARMEIGHIVPCTDVSEKNILTHALRNANVLIENPNDPPMQWRIHGRFIETSLVRSAPSHGLTYRFTEPLAQVPFNAAHKYSASLIHENNQLILTFVGAPDLLVKRSHLSAEKQQDILTTIEHYASQGELVLGVAHKILATLDEFELAQHTHITNLDFEGIITLRDPIRPGVAEALHKVAAEGIRTVLLTGDHVGTALAVAEAVGIKVRPDQVIEADELRTLDDITLQRRCSDFAVIARVAPLDKLRVLHALQQNGEVVAMTGDGVNDAPSIKQADVGIAMGSGTDVARDVADLVLLDDNYETIAAAVEEGRRIVHAIRGVLVYLFSSVLNEMILIGGALFLGLPLPLSALQILWVNFFADSFPAVAFAFEPLPPQTSRAQRPTKLIFGSRLRWFVIGINAMTSIIFLGAYAWLTTHGFDIPAVQSALFLGLGMYTLALAFPIRFLEHTTLRKGLLSNRPLVYGIGVGFILIMSGVYAPPLQTLLGTVALSPPYLALAGALALINLIIVEIGKWWYRKIRTKNLFE